MGGVGGRETERAALERPGERPRLTGPGLRGQRGPQVWRPRRGLAAFPLPSTRRATPLAFPPGAFLSSFCRGSGATPPRVLKKKLNKYNKK